MTTPPSSPPSTADDLTNAIVNFADTCEQAALQDAATRKQALTQSAQGIVIAARNWITDQQFPTPTPLPGS